MQQLKFRSPILQLKKGLKQECSQVELQKDLLITNAALTEKD
jgi:hypothetical protein